MARHCPLRSFPSYPQALHAPLLDAYGLTETGAIASVTPELYSSMRSHRPEGPAGAAPLRVVGPSLSPKIAIMDPNGQLLPPDHDGEIVVRGPSVMPGYLNDPEANAEAFYKGWFRTGDYGHIDAEGCLNLCGRLKEIINRGGQKIIPAEVEAVVAAHSAVVEAAVFGIPHPTLGEDVACAVVLTSGMKEIEAGLRRFVRSKLAFHKVPRRVFFVDAMPRGPTGKLQRRLLAERFSNAPREPSKLVQQTETDSADQLRRGLPSSNPTERRLLEMWCRILGRDDLEIDEDFFAAGGDSLAAMSMLTEADLRFAGNSAGSAAEFFDDPTISTVARLLKDTVKPGRTEQRKTGELLAFTVTKNGTRPRVFCIPANGDEGLYFRRLATRFDRSWPLTILRPGGAWYAKSPNVIEEAAADAVKIILETQAEGPYLIAGYCFGGWIAFETARQLSLNGEAARLVLLDVPAPGCPDLFRNWKLYLGRGIDELRHFRHNRDLNRTLFNVRRLLRRLAWNGIVHVHPAVKLLWRFRPVRWFCIQSQQNNYPLYLPKPLHAPILHLLSANDDRMFRAASRLGWRRVAGRGITERFVPLDHDRLFSESNLPILAAIMTSWFADETGNETPSTHLIESAANGELLPTSSSINCE